MTARQRIIEAATELLQRSPDSLVSTREICEAAGVTAPTLYHHFGDKEGLYDAVAASGFESYVDAKRSLAHSDDPVADLAHAWDAHVGFGVGHPALYSLMYGNVRARAASPAAHEARAVLVDLLARVATVGRLTRPVAQATSVVEAACVGATLQAIREGYDPAVSRVLRDTVLASVTAVEDSGSPRSNDLRDGANRLAALLDGQETNASRLRPTEIALLRDWLAALAAGEQPTLL